MGNPEFEQSCNLIRRAIDADIIDPAPDAIRRWQFDAYCQWPQIFNSARQKWLDIRERSPWLGMQQSWQLPATRRYRQSKSPGVLTQPSTSQWMVEACRFLCPIGSVGIIKSFQQYVSVDGTVYSGSDYWGNPYAIPVSISWFLRLSSMSMQNRPWINISGVSSTSENLPGEPYDDLSQTDDIWFPATSSGSTNIHLVVPGGYVLRVIAIVESSTNPVKLTASLSGTVQSETSPGVQTALQTTW